MEHNLQNQDTFDQHIHNKLSALESPMPAGSWEQFSKVLDAELPAGGEAAFDAIIKKTAGTISAATKVTSWDSLSRLMDKDPILGNTPENVADYAVRSKLNYSEPAYKAQHWQMLSDKLDLQDDRKAKVVLFKAIELALIFALLLTTFNYYVPVNLFEQKQGSGESTPQKGVPAKKKTTSREVPMAANTQQYFEHSDQFDANSAAMSGVNLIQIDGASVFAAVSPNANVSFASAHAADASISDQLPALWPTLLLVQGRDLQFAAQHSNSTTKPLVAAGSLRLGVSSKVDRNYIMTPYEAGSNEAAYNSPVWGYGAGVSISYQKGKLELESGFNYSNRKYQPRTTILQNTNPRSTYESYSVKSINMDIVEVPVNLRYHFAKKQKVKLYASAGVSMNLAMNTNYERVEYYPVLSPLQPRIAAVNPIKDGILHGGDFGKNSFLAANIGAGMEYALTQKHSVFLQTAYQHSLSETGVGPKNDRQNNFSIQAGARITL